mmetsp:Transcript_6385/g.18244  ORF Transcript_6385/g.18244 Transcript_6385/m.18244 type:complete len:271 (+) Transcript_6385:505-1317(+)
MASGRREPSRNTTTESRRKNGESPRRNDSCILFGKRGRRMERETPPAVLPAEHTKTIPWGPGPMEPAPQDQIGHPVLTCSATATRAQWTNRHPCPPSLGTPVPEHWSPPSIPMRPIREPLPNSPHFIRRRRRGHLISRSSSSRTLLRMVLLLPRDIRDNHNNNNHNNNTIRNTCPRRRRLLSKLRLPPLPSKLRLPRLRNHPAVIPNSISISISSSNQLDIRRRRIPFPRINTESNPESRSELKNTYHNTRIMEEPPSEISTNAKSVVLH